jgi:hypothetical protein
MARYKQTAEGHIPFTPEEEAEWDAKEAAYVPPSTPAATKEQLLAELAALTAKINAME